MITKQQQVLTHIRHPEVPERSEGLEGRRPGLIILRGSSSLAPQDDGDRFMLPPGIRRNF
jgi:hypothetical protein